jgi:hypothetical protein
MQLQKDREGGQRDRAPILLQHTLASAPLDEAGKAGRTQPGPLQPADTRPFSRLRVIVQTKARFGTSVGGGYKNFMIGPDNQNTKAVQVKDSVEKQGCRIKAMASMLNHQALGECHGLDVVRAMDMNA